MSNTNEERAQRLADAQSWAGYRQAHYSQDTGTLIVVVDGEAAFDDCDGGRWQTICDDHSTICSHSTLRMAKYQAAGPLGWCEGCIEEHTARVIAFQNATAGETVE